MIRSPFMGGLVPMPGQQPFSPEALLRAIFSGSTDSLLSAGGMGPARAFAPQQDAPMPQGADPWPGEDIDEPAPTQNRMVEVGPPDPEDPLFRDPGSTLEMGADQWSLRGHIYGQPAESLTPSMRQQLEQAKAGGATEDQLANMAANLAAGQGFRFNSEQEAELDAALRAPGATVDGIRAIAQRYGGDLEPKSVQRVIEFYQKNPQAKSTGVGYGAADEARTRDIEHEKYGDHLDKALAERQDAWLDPAIRGAASVPTLGFDDEATAFLDSLFGGSYDDSLKRERAISEADRRENPGWRTTGQVAGGFLLPTRIPGAARNAAITSMRESLAAGVPADRARAAAMQAMRGAMVRQGALEGTAYGSVAGAGSADGDLMDRGLGAVSGGALGGVTGGLVSGLGGQASRAFPQRRQGAAAQNGRDVLDAAERLNIQMVPADVGGPMTRRASSAISQTIVGGQPVINAAGRTVEHGRAARDKIAETFGTILDPVSAGENARSGVIAARRASGNEARSYYGAAENAAGGLRLDAPKAMAAIEEQISDLSEIPGGAPGLATLNSIRERLARGGLTVAGIRGMRTVLRDQFRKDGLSGSDIERRTNIVINAAADDVADGLAAAGKPDAAKLFAKGDAAWRDRSKLTDQVFQPIIGTREKPRSAEAIVKTMTADLRTNGARAVKLLNSLPAEQQGNQRASIIGAIGGEGDAFSFAKFATEWDKIPKSTKRAYFGAEATAALDDLAKVSTARVGAERYLNRSNTGGIVSTGLTAGSVGFGVPALLATVGGQYATGRLLASPRFTRWLARAPRTQLSAPAYIDRLNRIARSEPAIANDIFQLQQRLNEFVRGSASARLAAEEGVDSAPRVQVQQDQEDQYPGEELPQ